MYKIVSAQIDVGARSVTAVSIQLPRYTPGKQTGGGGEVPAQLSVLMHLSKVSGNAVCKKKLVFSLPYDKVPVLSKSVTVLLIIVNLL